MLQHGYPDREEHDAEHGRLVRELLHFGQEMGNKDDRDLSDYFARWLLEHIVEHDKALGEFLRAQRESGEAGT
jgi:hemerythrin